MKFMRLLCTLALFMSISWQAGAQYLTTVNGRIIGPDEKGLLGASVTVINSPVGTVADNDGYFSLDISALQFNETQLVFSFMGYERDTLLVNEQNADFIEIRLDTVTTSLGLIEVSGRFEGQQKALYQQRNAVNITNVVAAEQIKLFPDVNAAEAVRRVSGITLQRDQGEGRYVQLRGTPPELTNFNINGEQVPSPEGDVRYVGLDVISADQIESIEITKALTPDMNADGIGGTVNIVTKTATDTVPEINVSMAGGYNNIMARSHAQAQFSFAQRTGKLGFHINGNYYRNEQGAHNMEFKFLKRPTQEDESFQAVYNDIQLRHYEVTRERIGLSSTLDYEFSKSSNIYLKAMYNNFSDEETRRRTRYKFGSGTIINPGRALEASIERDLKDRQKLQRLSTINVGGEHEWLRFKIDYMLTYAYASESVPDLLEIAFKSEELDMELDLNETNWPRIIFPGESDRTIAFDYEDYDFNSLLVSSGLTTDRNLAYKMNFQVPYLAGRKQKGYLKFGFRVRTKHKVRDNKAVEYNNYYPIFLPGSRQVYLQEGPELSLNTVTGGFSESNMLNRGYDLGAHPDPEVTREFYEFYRQNFKMDETSTKDETYAEDYTANEDIYAAYGMLVHEYKGFTFLGGVRYERTDVSYQGYDFQTYKGRFFRELNDLESNKTYDFVLPQVHFKYALDPMTNFRLAATYTYARPNFEDILPYRQEDIDEVTFGNPDLVFPESFNIDLLAEKYIPDNGLLSGGLFFKRVDNFVFYYKRFVHLDSNFSRSGLKEVTMANNGLQAYVWGAEVNGNFKFKFLGKGWSNFGLFTNYTYTYSEASINERVPVENLGEVFTFNPEGGSEFVTGSGATETISMPGQAAHTFNLALFYDTKKFYAKIASTYQSAFLDELGQEADFDVYYDQSFFLDFSADYRFAPGKRIFVQAINLTNSPLKYYMGSKDQVRQQEFYSWSARIGFRFQL